MKLTLKLRVASKPEGLRIPIDRLPFLIGRDPLCHLRPASQFVSKHHCAIWSRDGQLMVRDLGSTNGTFLNDHPVTGEQQALNGDRLNIGPLLFDVCIEGLPSVSQSTPPPPMKARNADVEDAAAMLLLLEEDASAAAKRPMDVDPVPSGETINVPASLLQDKSTANQSNEVPSKGAASASSDTGTIANAILQKYLRRPRS
jgi:pSer/pThr/pTyr-binding forkhead associated (FHA) protein